MLDKATIRDRIAAARTLRGWSQDDMNSELAKLGWGAQDGGRIERGDKPLREPMIPALAKGLGVPEAWFTDQVLDLTAGRPDSDEGIDRLERKIDDEFTYYRGRIDRISEQRSRDAQAIVSRLASLEAAVTANGRQLAQLTDRTDVVNRDVSRTIVEQVVARLPAAAQDEQVAGDTHEPERAKPESARSRAAKKR